MKKTYQKPTIVIEKFELLEHIARHCGFNAGWSNHWDEASCGFSLSGPGNEDFVVYSDATTNGTCSILPETFEEGIEVGDYHGTISDMFSS